jgi:hypothetical protein
MAIRLKQDFKEFLKLPNKNRVKYLAFGGYAVNIHGYPRFTGDIDFWVTTDRENIQRVYDTIRQFGFNDPELTPESFQRPNALIRMGVIPFSIEIHTAVSGIRFDACYPQRVIKEIDGIPIDVMDLKNLIKNKRATGRHKDLDDVENLS